MRMGGWWMVWILGSLLWSCSLATSPPNWADMQTGELSGGFKASNNPYYGGSRGNTFVMKQHPLGNPPLNVKPYERALLTPPMGYVDSETLPENQRFTPLFKRGGEGGQWGPFSFLQVGETQLGMGFKEAIKRLQTRSTSRERTEAGADPFSDEPPNEVNFMLQSGPEANPFKSNTPMGNVNPFNPLASLVPPSGVRPPGDFVKGSEPFKAENKDLFNEGLARGTSPEVPDGEKVIPKTIRSSLLEKLGTVRRRN